MGSRPSKLKPESLPTSTSPPATASSFQPIPVQVVTEIVKKVDEAVEVSPTGSTNPLNELTKRRQEYNYSYTKNIPEAPFLDKLPTEQYPSLEWFALLAKQGIQISNDAVKDAAEQVSENVAEANSIGKIFQGIKKGLETETDQPADMQGYLITLYDSPDKVPSVALLDSDEAFGFWRVAGPNPTTLSPVESQSSIAWVLGLESSNEYIDRIQKAVNEDRLYQVDYSQFADFTPSSAAKFTMGAIALFEIPTSRVQVMRHSLSPLCIKLNSREIEQDEILFPNEEYRWKIAKAIFQSLDGYSFSNPVTIMKL